VRALLWPLFARSAWDQPEIVVEGTTRDGVAWAQPATVVAGTSGVGADVASVRFVGVGSGSNCGGGHDR
jgi:hypothetical protein